MNQIHKTAIIEDGATIGENVYIGAYTFISKNTKIANGVKIYQGAQIFGYTDIGEGSEIFSNAVIGSIPQDLKYYGEKVKLIIGKNNKIREFAFFNPGTEHGGGETVIGDNNLFMAFTHVAHDCIIGDNNIFANNVALAGHVVAGNYIVIGGHTPIHQFVKIGDHAMIGGASAVTQDIPPFCLAEGNRAVIKSLNLVGIRRRFEKDDINELNSAYKALFRSKQNIKQSANDLIKTTTNKKVKQLCEFILNTTRGIPYERI